MSIYNYVPNNWDGNNGVSINTTTLQKIEVGIKSSHERINSIENETSQNTENILNMGDNITTIDGEIISLQTFMDKFNLNGLNGQVLTLENGKIMLQSPASGTGTATVNISQWFGGTLYNRNVSTVFYNNGSSYGFYLCINSNTDDTFISTNWELIGETGFIRADSIDTLKNKIIDTSNNTITNIGLNNFTTGLIETDNSLLSDSDFKIPTVKSTKGYIDNKFISIAGGLIRKGSLDASLGLLPSSIVAGWYYIISKEGNLGRYLYVGDMIIANKTIIGSTTISDWDVIPNTLASDILREINISNNADFTIDTSKLANRGMIKNFIDTQLLTKVNTWSAFNI